MVAANPPEHLVLPDPAAVRQKIQSLDAEAARLRRLYRALLRVVESPASPPR